MYSKKENIEYIPEHYHEDDDDSLTPLIGDCQIKKTKWLKLGTLDDDGDDDDGDGDENDETYR